MRNKLIALNKNLESILDKLEYYEDSLALLLELSHGTIKTRPFVDTLKGIGISPFTITQKGSTQLAKKFEDELCQLYKQRPMAYIRLSVNIHILQRIMALESPTTLNIITDASQKKSLYFALSSKLSAFRSNIDDFIKQLRVDYKLNIIPDALEGLWAEFKKPTP